jgi:hypothetical protein
VGKGSINARINSSVLSLYDNERLKAPMTRSTDGLATSTWADADKAIATQLGATATAGKRIVVLTGTIISPSTKATIAALRNKYGTPMTAADGQTAVGGVDHVQYDTISYSGLTNANGRASASV